MPSLEDKHKLLKAICRKDFDSFMTKAFEVVEPSIPFEHNWHISCIAEHLQALDEGTLPDGKTRLCINIPPRTLKTYSASIAFPAWVMGRDPSKKFIATSYKHELARDMSQKTRILMESDFYKGLFKDTRIDDRQNEKHNFWTTQRGMYYTAAVSSITGKGADYVIIDDPINPKEAMSDTIRTEANATIRSTIPSRFNDPRNAKWILIMQRLHEDDPTGHFAMRDDRWFMLKLPAENKTSSPFFYKLGAFEWELPPNEMLFPQRLTRQVLDDMRDDLGEYNYVGQYLQEPVPLGGGEIQETWLQTYAGGLMGVKGMNIYILCDPANAKKKTSDWTVFTVIGLSSDKNYYVLDMVRDRLNPTERVDMLFMLHRKWNEASGKPPKVGYEKYGRDNDDHYIRKKMADTGYHFALVDLGGSQKKEDRIRRLIPDMQHGRWFVPAQINYMDSEGRMFDLISEMRSEMRSFPRSRWDDILDTMARIYEGDLYASFPEGKTTLTQTALIAHNYQAQAYTDFMDF